MSKRLFSQIATEDTQEDVGSGKAALPLSKSAPDLMNGIPLSGEDYLLVVRQQAKKCAKTMIAPPPKQIKKVQLPSHFQFFNDTNAADDQSCKVWRKGFAAPFQAYQKQAQQSKSSAVTHKEITSIDEAYTLLYTKQDQSLSEFIPSLSQHTILRLLKFHVQWLNTNENIELKCLTMFALLVHLDTVLISKNISILRDLSRECIKIRTSSPAHKAHLNIIISIIADTFGQADLL